MSAGELRQGEKIFGEIIHDSKIYSYAGRKEIRNKIRDRRVVVIEKEIQGKVQEA